MSPVDYDAYVEQIRQTYRAGLDDIYQQRFLGINAAFLFPILRFLGVAVVLILSAACFRSLPALSVGLLAGAIWLSITPIRQTAMIRRMMANEYRMANTGLPVVAFVVIANSAILRPGDGDAPALVLFVFEEQAGDTDFLIDLVERLNALQGEYPQDADLALAAQIRREEAYVRYRRRRLPASFTGGRVVYAADLYVQRDKLLNGFLDAPLILCIAEPGDSGALEMLPQSLAKSAAAPAINGQEG